MVLKITFVIRNLTFKPLVLSVLRGKMYRRMRSAAWFKESAQASSFDTISLCEITQDERDLIILG